MKNLFYILFLTFFLSLKGLAQPGAYGGTLEFKVYKDGKQVNLSGKNWKITPNNGSFKEPSKPYKYPDYYQIIPRKTPMGGTVKNNFYLDIVFKKDTMRVYTPNFSSAKVVLDSIPFKKGIFKIPQYVYELQFQKSLENREYLPNLNSDWSIFSTETYKCYLEKVTFLDSINEEKIKQQDGRLSIPEEKKYHYYYHNIFSNPVIINVDYKETGSVYTSKHKAYQISQISDTLFWDNRITPKPVNPYIKYLFYENKTLYAVIEKRYPIYPENLIFGIYKLHFVDDKISEQLKADLFKKQIEEEYEIAIRLTEKTIQPWLDRLEEIKSEYNEIIKTFDDKNKK